MRLNRHALATIRERSGLSKSQLASKAGVATGTISDLESGRRDASPEMCKTLADVLECTPFALMRETVDDNAVAS